MFIAEVSERTCIFKKTVLRVVLAAFATIVTAQVSEVVLQRVQLQNHNDSLLAAMRLPDQNDIDGPTGIVKGLLTPEKLATVDNKKLRQLLGATMDYFVALEIPARTSNEIEAALQAAVQLEIDPPTKLALANELNAALLYEDLLARIEALIIERRRRVAFAEVG